MSNDKVRLMIEVSEDTINECKVLFGQGYANNAEYAISQGTPIIDGDVEKAVEILRNYHNGYFGYKIDDVQKAHNLAITALVTSSTRPKGDLISRSDLRKEVVGMMINKADDLEEVEFEINATLASVCEKIDSAMSMNYTFLPQYQVDLQCAYDCGYEKGKNDSPKSEWVAREPYTHKTFCPFCKEDTRFEVGKYDNFCPNCGADLKGGKE